MSLEPTDADRKAAQEWAAKQRCPHPDDGISRETVDEAWYDGFLAGVDWERSQTASRLAEVTAERDALKKERAKLRTALIPFARHSEFIPADVISGVLVHYGDVWACSPTVGDFRRALLALASTPSPGGAGNT